MPDALIVGCGYVGERLARVLPGDVRCLTRSAASAARLSGMGFDAVACDFDTELPPAELGEIPLAYYMIPPPKDSTRDDRLRRWLASLRSSPQRIVYLSTTAVYGDAGGAEVDETTPPAPTQWRGRARLDAEAALMEHARSHGIEWVILRVPGIYGPGRLPLDRITRRLPMLRESEAGPGNRIHVTDLVQACVAAGTRPGAAGRVYNVGDGDHASTTTYLRMVARLAGLPEPPEVERAEAETVLTPMAWSFLTDSRRVNTRRMREELGVVPKFGRLEEGIRQALSTESLQDP